MCIRSRSQLLYSFQTVQLRFCTHIPFLISVLHVLITPSSIILAQRRRRVKFTKFLITRFPTFLYYFLTLRPNLTPRFLKTEKSDGVSFHSWCGGNFKFDRFIFLQPLYTHFMKWCLGQYERDRTLSVSCETQAGPCLFCPPTTTTPARYSTLGTHRLTHTKQKETEQKKSFKFHEK